MATLVSGTPVVNFTNILRESIKYKNVTVCLGNYLAIGNWQNKVARKFLLKLTKARTFSLFKLILLS